MRQTVIIDTNILFRALRTRNERLRDALTAPGYRFLTAKYLIVELFKHKERIVANAQCPESETLLYLHEILRLIEFVDEDIIHTGSYVEAYRLCGDIDPNDTPFVALTLELDALFWSGDEVLKTGLRKKGFHRFFEPAP
jgi:predicted nucleic acid-binding protein